MNFSKSISLLRDKFNLLYVDEPCSWLTLDALLHPSHPGSNPRGASSFSKERGGASWAFEPALLYSPRL